MLKYLVHALPLLLCLLFPGPAGAAAASPDLLDIRLSSVEADSRLKPTTFMLHVEMENVSGRTLRILKWRTPLAADIGAPIFEVKIDGTPAPYIGKLIKRSAPQDDDYLILEPGRTASVEVDLANLYDLGRTGLCTVEFSLSTLDIQDLAVQGKSGEAGDRPRKIRANLLSRYLAVPLQPPARSKTADFSGCSAWEQSVLTEALEAARDITRTARRDLANAPVDQRAQAERYLEWFGAYDPARYATVSDHFDKLEDALDNRQITFVCDCTDMYYAYVYPNLPYEIHPCQVFWNAPLTGTDSQAGTIVHETSHFQVVADTDDHVYGQSKCRRLADSYPALAIENADSHEYFAENTPALAMPDSTPEETEETQTPPVITPTARLQVVINALLLK